jgi:lambda family phage portal protein
LAKQRRRRTGNWFSRGMDWAIFQVAPGWGTRRMSIRRHWELLDAIGGRKLDQLDRWLDGDEESGGGVFGENPRTQGAQRWMTSLLARDNVLARNLKVWRKRSRELYETDGICSGAVEGCVTNVWGTGIIPQATLLPEDTGMDEATCAATNRRAEKIFERWAKQADVDGKQSYYDIGRLAFRNKLIDGESFILRCHREVEGKQIGLALEVIDADRIETPPDMEANPLIRMGIERNANGQVVAYHIRVTHPEDDRSFSLKWVRVEADRILHDFDKLFPSQTRGIPWMTPVMGRIRDLKDFTEAQLIAEQVAACYAAFVITKTGDASEMADGALSGRGASRREEELEPGRISYLPDDVDVKFSNPNRPGNTLAPYMQWQLRYVAAGLNYPYEMLVKDYRELSYSAAQMSIGEGRTGFRQRQMTTVSRNCDPIWGWVMTEAVITGLMPEIDVVAFDQDPYPFLSVKQKMPGWARLDPVKEIKASSQAVEENLSSETVELAATGHDLEDIRRDRLREKLLDLKEWKALKDAAAGMDISVQELILLFLETAPPPAPVGSEEETEDEAPPPKKKAA